MCCKSILFTSSFYFDLFLLCKLVMKKNINQFCGYFIQNHNYIDKTTQVWRKVWFVLYNMYFTIPSFPHSWLISGFVTRVTRRLPIWSRKCLSFWSTLGFYLASGCSIFSFLCNICRLLLVLLPFKLPPGATTMNFWTSSVIEYPIIAPSRKSHIYFTFSPLCLESFGKCSSLCQVL
jgi:hypothetical protein